MKRLHSIHQHCLVTNLGNLAYSFWMEPATRLLDVVNDEEQNHNTTSVSLLNTQHDDQRRTLKTYMWGDVVALFSSHLSIV